MKKRLFSLIAIAILTTVLVACSSSSSYDYYDSSDYSESTGETIRRELGDGPAEAYYEGERRWNALTGQ